MVHGLRRINASLFANIAHGGFDELCQLQTVGAEATFDVEVYFEIENSRHFSNLRFGARRRAA